jgi:hypothetical protein
MKRLQAFTLLAAIGACEFAPANGQDRDHPVAAYYPAFCSSPGGSVGLLNLEVFPDKGEAINISLPFGLGRFTYGPDGRALYGERRDKHELYRIDFNPIRASAVPAQASIKPIHSIAVSAREDRLLISGGYEEGGNQYCGVFEVSLPSGALRSVLQSPDCRYLSAWLDLSLSPDGTQAVAVHSRSIHSLDLIDIARGQAKSLGTGFMKASWSPDGRWIAALEYGSKLRTVLFDARRLSRARSLGESEVQWSPDSRYLLTVNPRGCSDESGTVQTLDIHTGMKTTIESSKCQVYQPTTGWVSSDIVR